MIARRAVRRAGLRVALEPRRPENSGSVGRPARRAVLALTLIGLLFAACEAAPLPSPSPTVPLARAQVERVWIDDPNFFVQLNEMVIDGDREIVVGVDFSQIPRHDEIEAGLRAGAPGGSVIEWPTDRRVTMRVPAGGPFDIDLSSAEPAPQSQTLRGPLRSSLRFHIDRPTFDVALYRPKDVLAGSLAPAPTWTVHLALQHILSFAADGHRVLVYHGLRPRRTDFSILDLDSGQKSTLAEPFMQMAKNGTSLMDWLPDGRLLGVAHATSVIGDTDGQHPVELPGLVGQGALLSPSGDLVGLWSYAEGTAAILDLATGSLRLLPGSFPRCTVGGIVALSWIDDDQLVISDCTADLGGTPRTRVLSARTGATLETRLGDQLVAILAGGVEFRTRVEPAQTMSSPQVAAWLADRTGKVLATLATGVRYLPAPDGSALAYANADGQHSVIIDPATGRQREVAGEAMTWTKQGELAVIRRR